MELIVIAITCFAVGVSLGMFVMEQSKRKLMKQSTDDMIATMRHLTDKTDMLKMLSKSNELMMRFNNGVATSKELLDILDEQTAMQNTISARAKQGR